MWAAYQAPAKQSIRPSSSADLQLADPRFSGSSCFSSRAFWVRPVSQRKGQERQKRQSDTDELLLVLNAPALFAGSGVSRTFFPLIVDSNTRFFPFLLATILSLSMLAGRCA
ncbi:hypothetical protein MGYG_06593 [Nannizzia gypsea CBS 118893]|uniref:Uncharacterized protein n=1 Tax=Arthroderma gypseum (strain ATCC MYA-4604 / CBS 118893) TaxID=535722 RepID=E4V2N7_ARTGP|nr:hypothetical protein MGYG_06593 [Nannizzia gypsea CBS 118893]EFR03599.1 hypothetical protein MGYG_06593 [Nannizzia gypsea CBS 118893]